jgi:hypothetical protein
VSERSPAVASLTVLVGLLAIIGAVGLHGALRDSGSGMVSRAFDGPAIVGLLLILTAVGSLIIGRAKALPARATWLAVFGCSLAVAIAAAELRQAYPVATPRSFPRSFAANHLQNFNLTESLVTGQNLLKGAGNTLPMAGGATQIDTYRMPGYPLLVASAGIIFRAPANDLESLGASTVYLQVLLLACAVAFLAYNLPRSVPTGVAVLLTAATCWFPQAYDLTQADSMILASGLLIAGSLCLFDTDTDVSTLPWRYHLLIHAAFGLWFVMRSDVLVGWAGVSVFLYRRHPRWLLLPLVFALAIGCSWGAYKKLHGSDFVMTTSNLGHVAFVGLWQTPQQHKFIWEPTDESYVQWINAHGYIYTEPRANAFALREVVRFWLTYPGFVISNSANKAYAYVVANVWTGSLMLQPAEWVGRVMRKFVYWALLFAIGVAAATGFKGRRTFLLGWPVVLNLPLFLVLTYNPRYVPFVSCSIMFAAVPLLASRDFYRRLAAIRWPLAFLLVGLCVVRLSGPALYRAVLSDRLRYWAPLLDPNSSTLNILK